MLPSSKRPGPRRRQAFSLGEVVVFSLLLTMLLGGMYLLLVAGMRSVHQSQAYQTAQQQALIGLRSISGELSNARADWRYVVYAPPTGSAIAFLSGFRPFPAPQDHLVYPPTGSSNCQIIWQKWVGFYLTNTTTAIAAGPNSVTPTATQLVRVENVTTGKSGLPANCPSCTTTCLACSFPMYDAGFPTGTLSAPPAVPTGPAPGGAGWTNGKVIARNISLLEFSVAAPPSNGITIKIKARDATASDKFTEVRYQVTAWLTN